MKLKKGTSLQNGRYRIESVLGQGGFGITYLAVQTGINLNRKVAIKEFFMSDFCERDPETSNVSLGTSGSRETVEKFKRKFITEACNIAKLHNPHVIRIIENFEENGTVYYVMDYIEGESLKDMLYPNKTLTEADALNYIRQVSDALAEVHANDMLHLDVKPGNIMVDSKGSVVLIDFGVSKRFDGGNGSEKLTTTTTLPYTPGYAPLEQMDQDASDLKPSADIYALGATLYRLLSGETPPTATALAGGRALPSLPSSVSPQVRRAIETAMQLNKLNRPQSVADFLALLDAPVSAVSEDTIKIPNVDESTVHEDDADKNDKTGNSVNASKVTDSKPVVVESENEKKKNKSWMLWVLIALIGIGVGLSALFVEGPSPVVVSDSDSVQVIASIVPVSVPAVESEDAPAPAVESEDVSAHTDKVDEDSLRRLQEELQAESLRIAEERRQAEEAELARLEEQRKTEEEAERKRQEAAAEEARKAEEERKLRDKSRIIGSITAVDLGLPSGTLWADRNVGASSPEDYGSYFSWGETEPKSIYDWSTYKWCNGSAYTFTKYCTDSDYGFKGFTDGTTNLCLASSDDAATANMGSSWRMPTLFEFQELIDNCNCIWTTQYGVNGLKVLGPNGNSIFFPAAGWGAVGKKDYVTKEGGYWSNWLRAYGYDPVCAYSFHFGSKETNAGHTRRGYGLSVRAVVR